MRDWRYVGDGAFVGPVARRWGWGSIRGIAEIAELGASGTRRLAWMLRAVRRGSTGHEVGDAQ